MQDVSGMSRPPTHHDSPSRALEPLLQHCCPAETGRLGKCRCHRSETDFATTAARQDLAHSVTGVLRPFPCPFLSIRTFSQNLECKLIVQDTQLSIHAHEGRQFRFQVFVPLQ